MAGKASPDQPTPQFFRGPKEGGKWPEEVLFQLARPGGYDELPDHELAALIEEAIAAREEMLRKEADRNKQRFLGRAAVLRQSRHSRPRTREPRFSLSPQLACKSTWRRIERLLRKGAWSRAYARAWRAWAGGDREALFPYGTYKMLVVHGVACAPPPD